MIRVTCGDNLHQKVVLVDPETSITNTLKQAQIKPTNGRWHLDGNPLRPEDMGKPLSAFTAEDNCNLINVAKATDG